MLLGQIEALKAHTDDANAQNQMLLQENKELQ